MTIKNDKNIEKYVEIVMEIERNKNKYIIYKDPVTSNYYGGKLKNNKLFACKEEEYTYLNNVLNEIGD